MRNILKAQLKIQQMAFMLMAVFIFFILVGMFYLVFQSRNIKEQVKIDDRNKAIEMANMLVSSAEFTCGDYCIDADRVMVLANRTAYKNFWKVSSIKIKTIYPASEREIVCTQANYPSCNLIKVISSSKGENTVSSFVSLCKRINENSYIYYKCELAKFSVGYEVAT